VARDFPRAERLLQDVLAQEPHNLNALDLQGFVFYFLERPADAEIACRKALELEPNRAYSMKGLGLCVAKQGRLDEGVDLLRKAIQLEPHWFDPRWDLAVVLGDAKRFDEAFAVLTEAEVAVPQEVARFEALRKEFIERRDQKPRYLTSQ
jgi:Flp pilus assembly protein TadD